MLAKPWPSVLAIADSASFAAPETALPATSQMVLTPGMLHGPIAISAHSGPGREACEVGDLLGGRTHAAVGLELELPVTVRPTDRARRDLVVRREARGQLDDRNIRGVGDESEARRLAELGTHKARDLSAIDLVRVAAGSWQHLLAHHTAPTAARRDQ